MRYLILLIVFLTGFITIIQAQDCPPPGGAQNGCQGCGGLDSLISPNGIPDLSWQIPVVRPKDPNDITGPIGYQPGKWVSIKDKLQYTVRFENDPKEATAPAQNVYIKIPAHPRMNLNSLKLTRFGFGNFNFTIPPNSSVYTARLDVADSLGVFVDITAGINTNTNEVFWNFNSIDTATNLPPTNALLGFLPVNDTLQSDSTGGKGEGYVTFTLTPKSTLLTGDTVAEQASIVFDINEPIMTNIWVNTIDAFPPTSHINGYTASNDTIWFHWSGTDDVGGIGVREYSLYVSEDSGPFILFRDHVMNDTSAFFTGLVGETYRFFSIATDTVGNREALKNYGEITVDLTGTPLPVTWLYFTAEQQGKDAMLFWGTASEANCRNYIIERSLDGRIFSEISVITAKGSHQSNSYDYTDKDINRFNVSKVFYRIRQVMQDNKFNYSKVAMLPLEHVEADAILKAYPNPFSQSITLKVLNVTASDEYDNVSIYSLDGKLRYQRKLIVQAGSATILLDDLPSLEPGIYLLKAVIDKKQYTVKMLRK